MARTRTPGIRTDRNGGLLIDKEHHGIPIYVRLGLIGQEQAEQRLAEEIDRVDALLWRNANRRPTFAGCAARYLTESKKQALGRRHCVAHPPAYSLRGHPRHTPRPRRHAAVIYRRPCRVRRYRDHDQS